MSFKERNNKVIKAIEAGNYEAFKKYVGPKEKNSFADLVHDKDNRNLLQLIALWSRKNKKGNPKAYRNMFKYAMGALGEKNVKKQLEHQKDNKYKNTVLHYLLMEDFKSEGKITKPIDLELFALAYSAPHREAQKAHFQRKNVYGKKPARGRVLKQFDEQKISREFYKSEIELDYSSDPLPVKKKSVQENNFLEEEKKIMEMKVEDTNLFESEESVSEEILPPDHAITSEEYKNWFTLLQQQGGMEKAEVALKRKVDNLWTKNGRKTKAQNALEQAKTEIRESLRKTFNKYLLRTNYVITGDLALRYPKMEGEQERIQAKLEDERKGTEKLEALRKLFDQKTPYTDKDVETILKDLREFGVIQSPAITNDEYTLPINDEAWKQTLLLAPR